MSFRNTYSKHKINEEGRNPRGRVCKKKKKKTLVPRPEALMALAFQPAAPRTLNPKHAHILEAPRDFKRRY